MEYKYNTIDGIELTQFNDLMDELDYYDDKIYYMDDFNDIFTNDAWQAVRGAFYGGRFNFSQDQFNPNDDYFTFNGYGNLISIPQYYLQEYMNLYDTLIIEYVNNNDIYLDGVEPIV